MVVTCVRESHHHLDSLEKAKGWCLSLAIGLALSPTLGLNEDENPRPSGHDTCGLFAQARERTKFCLCKR